MSNEKTTPWQGVDIFGDPVYAVCGKDGSVILSRTVNPVCLQSHSGILTLSLSGNSCESFLQWLKE